VPPIGLSLESWFPLRNALPHHHCVVRTLLEEVAIALVERLAQLEAAFAQANPWPAGVGVIAQQAVPVAVILRPVGLEDPQLHARQRRQAGTWGKARRVVAKIEHHQAELFPRVGFIVTNLRRDAHDVVRFCNGRGTAEQWIKEGKNAVKWTRLSCHDFVDNQVRLQLFALAYNLGNFLRRLALPKGVKHWSMTTLREKLIKIGAKVVAHSRYVFFQMAEVAIPRGLFQAILERIRRLRPPSVVLR